MHIFPFNHLLTDGSWVAGPLGVLGQVTNKSCSVPTYQGRLWEAYRRNRAPGEEEVIAILLINDAQAIHSHSTMHVGGKSCTGNRMDPLPCAQVVLEGQELPQTIHSHQVQGRMVSACTPMTIYGVLMWYWCSHCTAGDFCSTSCPSSLELQCWCRYIQLHCDSPPTLLASYHCRSRSFGML